MRRRTTSLALAALLVIPSLSAGSTPQVWRVGGVEGWTSAERESIGVTSEGRAGLALATQPVDGMEGFMVWALLREGDGALAATGDRGILYRLTASGSATVAAQVIQPEITALGRDGKGRVLLGAAPDGVIYRLEGEAAIPVADTPESYVWKILPDGSDGALLACGNRAKVYRMSGSGGLELLADLPCGHVTGLVRDGERLLATTEAPGRLIEIARDGGVSVLHEAAEGELREPLPMGDAVYFLANPVEPDAVGRLYRRSASGAVEQVWSAIAGSVYHLSAGRDGTLLVGGGADKGKGSITRVTPGPPSSWMELVTVTEPQVICALLDGDGQGWLGTGGQASVYRISGQGSHEGAATSAPFDAGGAARWGALSLEPGSLSAGLRIETRSGNTRTPDDSWSSWIEMPLDRGRGMIAAPSARFLQWRLRLSDQEVKLAAVSVSYLPANLAPRVSEVSVSALGAALERSWGRGQPVSLAQELPGGVRAEFQIPSSREGERPADDPEAAWARRYRTVTWKASDPNGDPLRFDIDLRGADEVIWRSLEKDEEASPWVWDSATMPDGWYVLRVTASDGMANPLELAATGHRETEPFLVDNTPPLLIGLAVEGRALRGVAEDAVGAIRSLELAVDGGDWRAVFPEDGIPDMPRETFRVDLGDLGAGEHVVLVRAADEAGNLGVARASFRVP